MPNAHDDLLALCERLKAPTAFLAGLACHLTSATGAAGDSALEAIKSIPWRNGMDRLGAMEVFVRVVESGSFSAAAKQVRVGQPAVSKTISQLEDHLGVSLLVRSPRGSRPEFLRAREALHRRGN